MTATGSVLIDTTVAIAHFRGGDPVSHKLAECESVYLPVVALGELYHGAYKSVHREKQLRQLVEFLPGVTVLDVDAGTADHYGRLRAALAKAGTPIPENDVWIAALARQHELPLATRDGHFALPLGVTVMFW